MSKKYEKPFLKRFTSDGPQIGLGAPNCKTGLQATNRCDVGTQATGQGCITGNQAAGSCSPTGTSVGS